MFCQIHQSPVSGSIFLKNQLDEWCSFRIRDNGAIFSPFFVNVANINISQWRTANGAATLDLLTHQMPMPDGLIQDIAKWCGENT